MNRFHQINVVLLISLLVLPPAPLSAKTRRGDRLRNEARAEELKGNLDHALELAEQAVSQDPGDPSYLLEVRRVRFEAGAAHVKNGQKIRAAGQLDQALAEFMKAYALDPASDIAIQEIKRTREMIERNKNGGQTPIASIGADEKKGMTPSELARRQQEEKTASLLDLPELSPLNNDPIELRMLNTKPRIMFETVTKLANVNVLFDPEYNQQQTITTANLDLQRTTLEEALDQIGVVTKSFWKPLSANTIFVTVDNPTKRREYAEQVVKVFYLSNVTSAQEMQEMLTVLRTVVDVQKVFNFTAQNALIVRAEADTMALVEKLISDLDKPKSEVVVDVIVMEVSSHYMRDLGIAFAPTGISTNAVYNPGSATTTPASGGTGGVGGTGTTPVVPATTQIPLSSLGHISSGNVSLTSLPGAQFEAVLNDSSTRVLQSPQIRTTDNVKASIKIGDKVPTATGSFQPGVAGVGVSPLVNTQFTFLDVGVNVDILPRVHDNNEVSLQMELDVSQVKDRIDLGGVSEPEISQNKASANVRLRDGEVSLIGGIMQNTNSRGTTGIPGLASIPFFGRLFSAESVTKDKTELVLAIVPHIVRGPDISEANLKGVASGNSTQIKVGYGRRKPSSLPATAPPQNGLVVTPSSAGPPATAPPPGAVPAAAPPATAPPAPAGPPTPGGPARISFLPGDTVNTQLSQAVTVTMYAENVADMVAATAHLQYDPRILRINNIMAGDLPQKNGAALTPAKNILNDSGQADMSITRGPEGGVSGAGGLFSIVFQAVGRGNTTVNVSGVSLSSSTGQPIPSNTPPPLTVNVQ
ncbi:MAG: secretin N-terminal domain-containing protein [Terriglobia bacterium]